MLVARDLFSPAALGVCSVTLTQVSPRDPYRVLTSLTRYQSVLVLSVGKKK